MGTYREFRKKSPESLFIHAVYISSCVNSYHYMVFVRSSRVYINWKLEMFLLSSLGGSNMVNNLKHIYHGWIGLPDSILINLSVLFTLRCCLDKMCSPASFPGLTYLVEVSYFVAFLALCILGCTLLPWLVLWFSTSYTLPFHTWGFSRWLTVIGRSLCSRIILSHILSTGALWFVALSLVLHMVVCSKVHRRIGIKLG